MKIKNLLCSLAIGLAALAASKASAFPIYLTSLSGTITSTADYGSSAETTSNKVTVTAVTLKKVMLVVSNQVYLNSGGTNIVPATAKIAYNPANGTTFLTNSTGYYQSLSGIVVAYFDDIATSFHATATGGTESDTVIFGFYVQGTAPDGLYFYFGTWGSSRMTYSVNENTQVGVMTVSAQGSDYGAYKASDDGVSRGSLVFRGSGTPEWEGPYSVAWWND